MSKGRVSAADAKYGIGWSFVYDVPVTRKKKKSMMWHLLGAARVTEITAVCRGMIDLFSL